MTPATKVAAIPAKTRLGSVLLDMGLISPDELTQLLVRQRAEGGRLGEMLVAEKRLSPEQVAKALAPDGATAAGAAAAGPAGS